MQHKESWELAHFVHKVNKQIKHATQILTDDWYEGIKYIFSMVRKRKTADVKSNKTNLMLLLNIKTEHKKKFGSWAKQEKKLQTIIRLRGKNNGSPTVISL